MTTAGPYWLWACATVWVLFSAIVGWGDLTLNNKNDRWERIVVLMAAFANTAVGLMLARTVGWL